MFFQTAVYYFENRADFRSDAAWHAQLSKERDAPVALRWVAGVVEWDQPSTGRAISLGRSDIAQRSAPSGGTLGSPRIGARANCA
jgi:hypothetical protein